MEKNNKIEEMLKQMSDILDFIESKAGKTIDPANITPEVLEKFSKIERDFEKFNEAGERAAELAKKAKQEILKGREVIEEYNKLGNEAIELMGVADPADPEVRARKQEAEKIMEVVSRDVPDNLNLVIDKANELKMRAEAIVASINPNERKSAIQDYVEKEDLNQDEKAISDKAFRSRRRRHLGNFGGDKV